MTPANVGSMIAGCEHFGLGLGLSIAKHLAEAQGGTIEAHSEGEGRGATFVLKLPIMASTLARVSDGRPSGDSLGSVPA